MKKFFFFAAVAALSLTTVSCNKGVDIEPLNAKSEISFVNVSSSTKGYVTGAVFYDTAIAELHAAEPVTTPRQMWVSAFLTPQAGEKGNYFVNEAFAINANGETDDKWHHAPKLYWPLDAKLDFLAYSAGSQLEGTKCVWDEANAASKLILNISELQSQDDIVYASNLANETSDADVAMEFKHTQAWIEFDLKTGAEQADLIKVNEISLSNIYMKGEATIVPGGTPELSWNFASYRANDTVVDDNYSVYGVNLNATSKYLDMLIPAQSQTKINIKYVLAGQDTVLEYEYALPTGTWEAGKKYIYAITFQPQEIIIVPTVSAFTNADMAGAGFPDVLN